LLLEAMAMTSAFQRAVQVPWPVGMALARLHMEGLLVDWGLGIFLLEGLEMV
jgi:hypothetical protein